MAQTKRSKNQIRRERAKQRKLEGNNESEVSKPEHKNDDEIKSKVEMPSNKNVDLEVDTSIENNPLFEEYKDILTKHAQLLNGDSSETNDKGNGQSKTSDGLSDSDESDDINSDSEWDGSTGQNHLTRKEIRKLNKVPLASLKASTRRPQVVDWFDVDARDPYLLTAIKSSVNVVQVPEHWSSKRAFLSTRRGLEKPPFKLPKFILDTGIQDMRNSKSKSLKEQQRERVQPKMGKLDIDYQKLYNAFFKYKTKPRLLGFGDVYFEGREHTDELDDAIANIRPGCVSSKLREALGLSPNDNSIMPPWITIMYEIGKPPAYNSFLIPGLDVDYNNKGYVTSTKQIRSTYLADEHWGKLVTYESSSDEGYEDEEEDEQDENDEKKDNENNGAYAENIKDISNDKSDKIPLQEISKHGESSGSSIPIPEDSSSPRQLYTVLKEQFEETGSGLLKSEIKYKIKENDSNGMKETDGTTKENTGSVSENFKF